MSKWEAASLILGWGGFVAVVGVLYVKSREAMPAEQLRHADGTPCWRGTYHRPDVKCYPPEPHQD